MCQILLGTRKVIINHQYLITFFEKLLSKMWAQKASASGDKDFVIQKNSLFISILDI